MEGAQQVAKDRHRILKLLDVQSRFFIPLWRRVALVALCLLWALFEFSLGSPGWAIFFVAIGLYCAHQFFVAFDPPQEDGEN